MSDEFRKIKSTGETRFVLEFSDAGVSSSVNIASIEKPLGELQRRAEPPKPRNFVAKNAKMGGAGQHKDKKKAAKQGDVKHKKPLAESYAEDLAKQVFNSNPNIKDENAVLDAAWPIVVQDLGKKTAMSMFNYDEDFPSDLVSVYDWLQKNQQQGVAEGSGSLDYDKILNAIAALYGDDIWDNDAMQDLANDLEQAGPTDQELDFIIAKGKLPRRLSNTQFTNNDNVQFGEQGVAEGFNGEYDDEAGMAHSNLLTSARAVQGLLDTIEDRDNLPEWAQEKIAKAEMMLVSVWDYLQSQKEQGIDPQIDMEEGRSYHDNRTGFSRGPRDDERHDLDVPSQDPREFRMYNLTVDGKPLNPQPIMGRSNLIKFGKQQAAAGVDLSNAIISLVDENVAEGPGRELTNSPRDRLISRMSPGIDHNALMQKVEKVVNSPEFDRDTVLKIVDAGDSITHPVGRYIQTRFDELQYDLGSQYEDYPERVADELLKMLKGGTQNRVAEVAPKGWEGTVKAMKKHKEIDNPYALTNWMKNKGYQSHKKEDAYMESLAAKLANKLK